jgi:homocitrate synthase
MSTYRPERLYIVDSTLREGEQTAGASLTPGLRLALALRIEEFGADYIELTNPLASRAHRDSCRAIARALGTSKALAHIRCRREDAGAAMDCGVGGINLFIGASRAIRAASGLGSLADVVARAADTLGFIKARAPRIELRLSLEDAFRAPIEDVLLMAGELGALGLLDRIGLADTTGVATPAQVAGTVRALRGATALGIEFHAHNDTGCATANSYAAFMAGAAYIDTSVLGLGERNGITPLAELMARMSVSAPDLVHGRYALDRIHELHAAVAEAFGVEIPVNHCLVGRRAFTHRAGVHIHAVKNDPVSYEALSPSAFGRTREIDLESPVAGRHASHTGPR